MHRYNSQGFFDELILLGRGNRTYNAWRESKQPQHSRSPFVTLNREIFLDAVQYYDILAIMIFLLFNVLMQIFTNI